MIKFKVRQIENHSFYSAVFKTKEEAGKHSNIVKFTSNQYAGISGLPCSGWVPLDAWSKPLEIEHVEA